MDLLSPLLEFEQLEDLFPFSPLEDFTIQGDLLVPPLESKNDNSSEIDGNRNLTDPKEKHVRSRSCRKRKSLNPPIEKIENLSDGKNKKAIHREVERQRRKEMTDLNSSLKSLLPPQDVKGRRSLCDNLHDTVSYIRYLQMKIGELSKIRDELKRSSNRLSLYVGSKCLPSCFVENEVAAVISSETIQIVLSPGSNSEAELSRVLDLLIQEGLNVINCTSTNLNERLVHTIESKVSGEVSINPYELQKKLKYLVA